MKIKLLTDSDPTYDYASTPFTKIDHGVVLEQALEPIVEIDVEEVERLSGMSGGPGVARIDVKGPNGKISRFWVSVALDGKRRPVASISTKPYSSKDTQVTRKLRGGFNIDNNSAPASSVGG